MHPLNLGLAKVLLRIAALAMIFAVLVGVLSRSNLPGLGMGIQPKAQPGVLAMPLAVTIEQHTLNWNDEMADLYLTNLDPLRGVDLKFLAIVVSGILLIFGMTRRCLISLRPVYRDALLEQMDDGAIVVDAEGRIVDLNTAAQTTLAAAHRPVGEPADKILTSLFDSDAKLALLPGFHETLATRELPSSFLDVRVTPLDAASGYDEGARLIVWRNVTASRKAMATVCEQERIRAVMAERERADQELATWIQRMRQVVKIQTQAALLNLDAGRPDIAAVYLARAGDAVAEDHRSAPEHSQGFEPFVGDFLTAVRFYVEQFAAANRLNASLETSIPNLADQLKPEQCLQAFRIMQEALENVRLYAQAQSIWVSFTATENAITLLISDDGIGFHLESEEGHGDLVLESLCRRAHSVGAQLTVHSAPGCGTTIKADFPFAGGHKHRRLAGLRVVVADHHPLVLEGLSALLANEGAQVIAVATSGDEAVAAVIDLQPELILLDLEMPGDGSVKALQQIKQLQSNTKAVLTLTSDQDPKLSAALHLGADGYLLKSLDTERFFALLAQIARDELLLEPVLASRVLEEFKSQDAALSSNSLTRRQKEILRLVALDMTYAEMGARLFLSKHTVRYHMDQIRVRLNLADRTEVLAYARSHGYGSEC